MCVKRKLANQFFLDLDSKNSAPLKFTGGDWHEEFVKGHLDSIEQLLEIRVQQDSAKPMHHFSAFQG